MSRGGAANPYTTICLSISNRQAAAFAVGRNRAFSSDIFSNARYATAYPRLMQGMVRSPRSIVTSDNLSRHLGKTWAWASVSQRQVSVPVICTFRLGQLNKGLQAGQIETCLRDARSFWLENGRSTVRLLLHQIAPRI